jgi:hypothetical protein
MWTKGVLSNEYREMISMNFSILITQVSILFKEMAYPARLVFTPFVVVVGGKYFLPVPECLIFLN